MNSKTMWVARIVALLAPPMLIFTGMFDPWWGRVALGVVWALTLQLGAPDGLSQRQDTGLQRGRGDVATGGSGLLGNVPRPPRRGRLIGEPTARPDRRVKLMLGDLPAIHVVTGDAVRSGRNLVVQRQMVGLHPAMLGQGLEIRSHQLGLHLASRRRHRATIRAAENRRGQMQINKKLMSLRVAASRVRRIEIQRHHLQYLVIHRRFLGGFGRLPANN